MAGFAIMIAPDTTPQALESDFQSLLRLTAGHKQLEIPSTLARGMNCMAGKLDSPTTIHPGIVRDDQTGSWLMAAGTVVALEGDNHPLPVLTHLLQNFLKSGRKALEMVDGQFALVIYNGLEGSLSVVSDPIGMFGIFFSQQGNKVFISSSALAVATLTHSQPDILAVEHFLRTNRLDADKTLWLDVKRLLGGMALVADHGCFEKIEYWSPTYDKSVSRLSLEDALDQTMELLSHAFSRTLSREGKIWVDLTGGFDTRLTAMLVAKIKVPFSAYCMGPEDHPDVQISRKVSEEMKWDYVNTQLPEQWEPALNSWFKTALGCGDGRVGVLRLAVTMRGFKERNTTIKTNVTGVGGENLRGYRWQIEGGNIGRTTKVNYAAWLDNIMFTTIPMHVMRYDRTSAVRQELSDFILQLCSKYSSLPNTTQIDRFEFGRDAGLGGAYLSGVTSIQRSLIPLFLKELVNFTFSMNYRWKLPYHHILIRKLFERENKRLGNLATTSGGPAVPIRVTNLHKFWPLWKGMAKRAVAIGSRKVLGKIVRLTPHTHRSGYPLPAWQTAFYAFAESEGMLDFDAIYSQGLYKRDELHAYIKQAKSGQTNNNEFLDRVISVEMAMRAVGSRID